MTPRIDHPHIRAGMRRGRRLADCDFLTAEDWQAIHGAQLAFLYQVRLIVDRAEKRKDPPG